VGGGVVGGARGAQETLRPPASGSCLVEGQRRLRFWGLTTGERLEAIDAVKRGAPPRDRDQAVVFMEMVDPFHRPASAALPEHTFVEHAYLLALALVGGVSLWVGDGILGGILLMALLVFGFRHPERVRRLERVEERRTRVLAMATPYLDQERR
jgi:hypothetical protein